MKNLSMKSTMIAAALATAGALGFASTASAACMQEGSCFDEYSGVSLGGTATFSGFGGGMFEGEDGGVLVNKEGGAWTSTTLSVAGDLCGVDCRDGSFTFDAGAFETVNVKAGASGQTSGHPVVVVNEGGAASYTSFDFGKFNITNND